MISLADFYMGRDRDYAAELTSTIEANAVLTVNKVNQVLAAFYGSNPGAGARVVTSGWRPPAVNAGVRNAAPNSRHMTGEACDLSDDDEALDTWLCSDEGMQAMIDIGLWMEHPFATPRWTHVQIVPPGSGRRIFMP